MSTMPLDRRGRELGTWLLGSTDTTVAAALGTATVELATDRAPDTWHAVERVDATHVRKLFAGPDAPDPAQPDALTFGLGTTELTLRARDGAGVVVWVRPAGAVTVE